MRLSIFAAAATTLLALIHTVVAYNIVVPAGERRCFYEDLEKDDHLHVSFQISDPNEMLVEDAQKAPSASYNLAAKMTGRYQYCFSNAFSTMTEKQVGFNVLAIKPIKSDGGDNHKADPLEREIRDLASAVEEVKYEQEYTVARERTHRNTAESTNSRVVWWSLFQAGLLFAVCGFQITYLKRFFEVKRVV
ncbi:p24 complex component [Actinomortierella ambigua]|uniref:P24 complex component n=1 Tax=Actinomortierella ambigua TaxID=1343610 RepID=A0A9P6UAI5_9FUNG|nr:p24 complex component [Actinomortierella ambigua]KAG0266335.1 p24 complex component [Actinomortierella ambigua]